MDAIVLKSSVHWCKHILRPLLPLDPSLHPDEEVFKFETEYSFTIVRDEVSKLPIGIDFCYGPDLRKGKINPQIGMKLKEICNCYDKDGEYIYNALVFTKNDISGNETAGVV